MASESSPRARTSTTSRGMQTFSDVFERARRGDRAAMAELYGRYARHVMTVVHRRLPPALRAKYDTMDLAQSVFAEVLRGLARLEDRGEAAFARLLVVKAENKVRLKLRRHLGRGGRRAEAALPHEGVRARGTDAVVTAASRDDAAKLARLVSRLDETSRRVLHLRIDGRSFAEIATELSISAAACRQRHVRALALLRERWGPAAGAGR